MPTNPGNDPLQRELDRVQCDLRQQSLRLQRRKPGPQFIRFDYETIHDLMDRAWADCVRTNGFFRSWILWLRGRIVLDWDRGGLPLKSLSPGRPKYVVLERGRKR